MGGERPVLHITIPSQALIDGGRELAWLESQTGIALTPITATAAQRLSCDAVREICIISPDGHLDALSARQSTIPRGLRRAVTVRDRGQCRFPGCHAAIREIHHVVFRRHGGDTTTANLIGLCSHHHHLIHDGGWQLRGDPNTTVTVTQPNGRFWSSDPPI